MFLEEPVTSGEFRFGLDLGDSDEASDAVEGVVREVADFQLHRWAVCNSWYIEFEPKHSNLVWFAKEETETEWIKRFGADAIGKCPVVRIDWYDAWAFAHWCGAVLPDEVSWEFAGRGGVRRPKGVETAYYWGAFSGYSDCSNGSECNCDGRYPDAVSGVSEPENGPNLSGLVPLNYAVLMGYPAHPLGLDQMYGNT